MIKLTGQAGNVKNVQWMPKAKYIITTTTLSNPPEQVSNIGNNVSSQKSSLYVNELGKQLLVAAASGNVTEIKYLLSKGAPFTADWLGTSPLHLAAQNNHLSAVEVLLKSGISKDARTKVDRTPLHMAAYEGHLSVVDALIQHGADIECRDLLEMTPLHWAAQNGHLAVVEHLLKCGANADVTNKFDLTPACIARQIDRADVVNALENSLASSALAAENLVIELNGEADRQRNGAEEGAREADDVEMEEDLQEPLVIPLEPSIINQLQQEEESADESEINDDPIELSEENAETLIQSQSNLSDSLKLLEAHGITMLENESNDTNILNSVMESGHSVVLTDVGKEVLNSVKRSVELDQLSAPKEKNVISITTTDDELMDMEGDSPSKDPIRKPLRFRRVIMKKKAGVKDQLTTFMKEIPSDMELVMNQLIEAKKTISELKSQLQQKELEAERYKMQLKLLMDSS